MEIAMIAVKQTAVMFLYILAGWSLFKTGKLTEKGSRDMATLLVWLIIPAVIVNSFCVELTAERLKALGISSLMAVAALGLAMLVGRMVYPHKPIENFGAAFSNAGFMGIPLVRAMLGAEAVFYTVAFVALLNILQATYGVWVLTDGKKKTSLKSALLNPILAGSVLGLVLFLTGLGTRLPSVCTTALGGLSAVNAPLAMLVLGVYMAKSPLKLLFTSRDNYALCLIRLLLIPAVTAAVFLAIPVASEIRLAVLLAAAAPVGANVAVYAQLNDLDYGYACRTVALSTLLSVLSLPLVVLLAAMVL